MNGCGLQLMDPPVETRSGSSWRGILHFGCDVVDLPKFGGGWIAIGACANMSYFHLLSSLSSCGNWMDKRILFLTCFFCPFFFQMELFSSLRVLCFVLAAFQGRGGIPSLSPFEQAESVPGVLYRRCRSESDVRAPP